MCFLLTQKMFAFDIKDGLKEEILLPIFGDQDAGSVKH